MGFASTELNVNKYIAKRNVFTIGNAFSIMDVTENLLLYGRQKLFKLKEDIRVFDSKDMNHEVLNIKARQILDFSAAYDVVDSATNEKVGALRRRGFSSMIRDQWEILDRDDNLFATIKEDSTLLALVRRLLLNIIPQSYIIEDSNGGKLGIIKQRFNLFMHIFDIDLSSDNNEAIDRRLGMASVILLLAIEGKQR